MGQNRNVVLILADQMRADIAYHQKYPFVRTPNLDRLRADGVTFNAAFCQSPVCGPSRASLNTGRYPQEHGVTNNRCLLPPDERTIGHHLRDLGYTVRAFGKTHGQNPGFVVAPEPPLVPTLGTSTWGPYRKSGVDQMNGNREFEPLVGVFDHPVDDHFDFIVAREAGEFLAAQSATDPFFLFVGLHGPHPPFLPPREFADMYSAGQIELPQIDPENDERPLFQKAYRRGWQSLSREEQLQMTVAYLAQVSHVDAAAGRIMDAVQQSGHNQDTVVIFLADHGDQLGEHGITGKFNNFFDASVRCPLIMRVPGAETVGRMSDELVELVDVYPTVCDLLGHSVPESVSGKSFRSVLETPAAHHREYVTSFLEAKSAHEVGAVPDKEHIRGMMIRDHEWKLAMYSGDSGELYAVGDDPGELVNRIDDDSVRDVRQRLTEMLAKRSLSLQRDPSLWQLNQFAG